MRSTRRIVMLSIVAGIAAATPAHAAAPAAGDAAAGSAGGQAMPGSVQTQVEKADDPQRQALEPIGARLGSFILYPKLETALTYDDNIYALQDKTDDLIARISPSLDLEGDFGSTTTALRASLDRLQYFDRTTENRTDWNVGANAQFEAQRNSFVYLAAGHSHLHEDRGDPNAIYTSRTPTSYHLTEAGFGLSSNPTRLLYGVDGSYRKYDYQNNVQLGGQPIDNQDRDRELLQIAGRLGYEFSPGYNLLARVSYERTDYTRDFDDSGFDRDSYGLRASLGVDFEITQLLTGEIYGGWLHRTYDDPRFRKIDRVLFGSNLTWQATRLTTVRLDVDRRTDETIAADYSSFLNTSATLSVEHELLRTVLLDASVGYARYEYARSIGATVAPRSDDNYSASLGVKYTLNRNLYAGLNYDWTKRTSNVDLPGVEFDRNRVSVKLGLQF